MNKKSHFVIGIILSLIVTSILLINIDISVVINEIYKFNSNYIYILPFFFLASLLIRTLRWKILLSERYKIDNFFAFKANALGFLFNYLMPAKFGEFLRAELIKKKYSTSRSFAWSTILVERLFDSLVLSGFLAVSILYSQVLLGILKNNLINFLILCSILILLLIIVFNNRINSILINKIPDKISKRITSIFSNIKLSFNIVKNPNKLLIVLLLTLILWLMLTYLYYLVAVGLNIHIYKHAFFFIISMAAFGMILPSSPGNIGVFQGVTMSALLVFYPNKEKALSFAILVYAFDFIPCIIVGTLSLIGMDYSLLKKFSQNISKNDEQ